MMNASVDARIASLEAENASLLGALKASHATLKAASKQLTEDHRMVLMGRGWGWQTLATIEGVIAKSEAEV